MASDSLGSEDERHPHLDPGSLRLRQDLPPGRDELCRRISYLLRDSHVAGPTFSMI